MRCGKGGIDIEWDIQAGLLQETARPGSMGGSS